MDFDILNRRALDWLWRPLHGTLDQNNALHRQARGPFGHLLAHFPGRDSEQGLDGVDALAEVEKDHLATLRTRCLDAGPQEDLRAVRIGREGRNLRSGSPWAGLRLVQRELSIEVGRKVLCRGRES